MLLLSRYSIFASSSNLNSGFIMFNAADASRFKEALQSVSEKTTRQNFFFFFYQDQQYTACCSCIVLLHIIFFFIRNNLHLFQYNVQNDTPTYIQTLSCQYTFTPVSWLAEWVEYHRKTLLHGSFKFSNIVAWGIRRKGHKKFTSIFIFFSLNRGTY